MITIALVCCLSCGSPESDARAALALTFASTAPEECWDKSCDCGCLHGFRCTCLDDKVKKSCGCSKNCTCGCNSGEPCRCASSIVVIPVRYAATPRPVYQAPRAYLAPKPAYLAPAPVYLAPKPAYLAPAVTYRPIYQTPRVAPVARGRGC